MAVTRTRKYLYDYLKDRVYRGKLNIPHETHHDFPSEILTFVHRGVSIQSIRPEEKTEAKEYMAKNFFSNGPVPNALKLYELAEVKGSIVQQELDYLIDNDCSISLRCVESGKLISVGLNCMWDVDTKYDCFEVDAKDWLNLGGQIANEVASCDSEASEIWRDYQYQLLYHKFITEAKKHKKNKVVYSAMQYTDEEFRDRKLSHAMIDAFLKKLPDNIYLGMIGTFPGYRRVFGRYFGDLIPDVAYVPFDQLTFDRNGKRVFGECVDGMAFQGTIKRIS